MRNAECGKLNRMNARSEQQEVKSQHFFNSFCICICCVFKPFIFNFVHVSWCGLTSGIPINEDNNNDCIVCNQTSYLNSVGNYLNGILNSIYMCTIANTTSLFTNYL